MGRRGHLVETVLGMTLEISAWLRQEMSASICEGDALVEKLLLEDNLTSGDDYLVTVSQAIPSSCACEKISTLLADSVRTATPLL